MAPTCTTCKTPLAHITGHAVIRLYRCNTCGSQAMLPGDPNAPLEAEAQAPAQAAAAAAAAPPQQKKGFFAKLFGG